MSHTKRKHATLDYSDSYSTPTKRQRSSPSSDPDDDCSHSEPRRPFREEKSRVDPTYGQRTAVPGLDDDEASEPSDEDTANALRYLRSVRSEARTIPNLLCAPKNSAEEEHDAIYNSGLGDSRGYYSEGAYVAAPAFGPFKPPKNAAARSSEQSDVSAPSLVDAQDAYHSSLLRRFDVYALKLRSRNNKQDAPDVSAGQIYFDEEAPQKARHHWSRRMVECDPTPAYVVQMSQETVLHLLEVVTARCLKNKFMHQLTTHKRIGAWIWALMGRLGHVGTLGSEEVSTVRELGKKAVAMSKTVPFHANSNRRISLDAAETPCIDDLEMRKAALHARLADAEPTETSITDQSHKLEHSDISKSIETFADHIEDVQDNGSPSPPYRKRNTSSPLSNDDKPEFDREAISEEDPKRMQQTVVATLDMILTLVGERYGQRDLLHARESLWEV